MRARIFSFLILATICAAERGDYPIISASRFGESSGKIEVLVQGNDERLNDIINNPDPRLCERITVVGVPIDDLRRLFDVYGKQSGKLFFEAENTSYKAQDLFDVLNLLPNLEELKFDVNHLDGEADGILNLKNLFKLSVKTTSKDIWDFLAKILPENVITDLEVEDNQEYENFLTKQSKIKTLTILADDPIFNPSLNLLKLDKINLNAPGRRSFYIELLSSRRNFIKAFIESQPELKFLEFEYVTDGLNNIVNDEILAEISKLSKLEKFELVVDPLTNLQPLENLRSLKELRLSAEKKKSTKLFNQFADLKLQTLKILTIIADFELPSETYEKMSQNFPNLKSLSIAQSFHHSINFFAKNFHQLETLLMTYGDFLDDYSFGVGYDKSLKVVNENLKTIELEFLGDEPVSVDDFNGFVEMFPNLEELMIRAKFPFNAEIFTKLADQDKLKVVRLWEFQVDNIEQFTPEISNALKVLPAKLKYIRFLLKHQKPKGNKNVFNSMFGGFNNRGQEQEDNFTFQPLIDELKDVFNITKRGKEFLILESGSDEKF